MEDFHRHGVISMHPPEMLNSILTSVHLRLLSVAFTLIVPLITLLYIHRDYKAFLALGPGGTPSTPFGYLKIKLLSLICLRDPLRPVPVPLHFRPSRGYLFSLPTRSGERPVVRGIAPQRQQTQKSTGDVYKGLVRGMRKLVADPANHLAERTSCFEKHSSGIFASIPITRTCNGEVCHVHPSDGSMHMTLHPADAKIMIESGWGERHPLARGGWCRRFVPREFVLVYAPRNIDEIEVVMKIVAAGIWWVAGIDVDNVSGERRDPTLHAEAFVKKGEDEASQSCGMGSKGVEKIAGDM